MKKKEVFEKQKFYRDGDSGKIFLFSLLIAILISLIFSIIASKIATNNGVETAEITSNMWFLTAYGLTNAVAYIVLYLIYTSVKKIEFNAIDVKFNMKWHTYLIVVLVGVVSLFGLQYFIGAIDNLWKVIGLPLQTDTGINPVDAGTYILGIFVLALIPAISEEVIYRGIVLNGLRNKFSDVKAVLLSGTMFSLMHGNLQQLVYTFILGCVMGWIVVRTGSLISSILVHFINNFLVVTLSFIQNTTGWSLALPDVWWFYCIAVALLVVTFVIYFLIDRFYFHHKSKLQPEKGQNKVSAYVYVSIGVSLVILLLNTIASFA